MKSLNRCGWARTPLSVLYHDKEWGVPLHDDRRLFEFLILEGAQAGLSWETILAKRENYRKAFARFHPHKVATFTSHKINELLDDSGIVRNRLKINAAVINAQSYLQVLKTFKSFDDYLWQFVEGTPQVNHWKNLREVPCQSTESNAMSKDLLKRGFKFVGPTICYAFMQAVGMVNDHTMDCFRHQEVNK